MPTPNLFRRKQPKEIITAHSLWFDCHAVNHYSITHCIYMYLLVTFLWCLPVYLFLNHCTVTFTCLYWQAGASLPSSTAVTVLPPSGHLASRWPPTTHKRKASQLAYVHVVNFTSLFILWVCSLARQQTNRGEGTSSLGNGVCRLKLQPAKD